MKRAKLHRSHLQQTIKMKITLLDNQKQHIIDILEEYVGDVIKDVEEKVDWDASDQNQINGQYQTVIGSLTKASTLLDQLANNMLDTIDGGDEEDNEARKDKDDNDDDSRSNEQIQNEEDQRIKCTTAQNKEDNDGSEDQVLSKSSSSSLSEETSSSTQSEKEKVSSVHKKISPSSSTPQNLLPTNSSSAPNASPSHSPSPPPVYTQHSSHQFPPPSSPLATLPSHNTTTQPVISHCTTNLLPKQAVQVQQQPWSSSLPVCDSVSQQSYYSSNPHQQTQLLHLMNQPPPPLSIPPHSNSNHSIKIENFQGQPLIIPPSQPSGPPLPSLLAQLQLSQPASQLLRPPPPQPFFDPTVPPLVFQQQQQPQTMLMPPYRSTPPPPPPTSVQFMGPQDIISQPQLVPVPSNTPPLQISGMFSTPPPMTITPPLQQQQQQQQQIQSQTLAASSSSSAPDPPLGSEAESLPLPTTQVQVVQNTDGSFSIVSNKSSTALNPDSSPFLPKSVETKSTSKELEKELKKLEASIENPTTESCNKPQEAPSSSPVTAKNKTASSLVPRSSSLYSDKNHSSSWEDFSRLIEKFSETESENGASEFPASRQSKPSESQDQKMHVSSSTKIITPLRTGIEKGSILAGTVLEPDNPWSFYVQMGEGIDQIAQDISDYIKGGDGSNEISSLLINQGMFCLALFPEDGNVYRAKVLDVKGDKVNVVYVDYGNTCKVSTTHLRPLPASLATRPVMAMWCALSGAAPTNSENMWTEEAILHFQKMVCDQSVQIRVVQLSSENKESGPVIPHLVNIVFKMAVKSSTPGSSKQTAFKPVEMSRMLIREKLAKAVGMKEQVATLIKLNQPTEKRIVSSEKLKSLDDLFNSMKSSTSSPSSKKSDSGGWRKAEPLCFTNVRKSKGPKTVETFKRMLKSSSMETIQEKSNFSNSVEMKGGKEKRDVEDEEELVQTPKQKHDYNLACLVNERLCELGTMLDKANNNTALKCSQGEGDITHAAKGMIHSVLRTINNNDKGVENGEVLFVNNDGEHDTTASSDDVGGGDMDLDTEIEFPVLVSEILTPNSFFVHPVTQEAGEALVELEEDLTAMAKELSKKMLDGDNASVSFTPKKFRLCCAQFVKVYGAYCRALVLDANADDALVFAVDYGHCEWQHKSRLLQLPSQYTQLPPLVLWCSLSYTQPAPAYPGVRGQGQQGHTWVDEGSRRSDSDDKWSWSAVEKFRRMMCKDKPLNVVASKSSINKCIQGSQSFQTDVLPIYLLDRSNPGDEICLNHELIHRGLASVRKSALDVFEDDDSDGYLHDVDEDEEDQDWNPMVEDFESIRNSYKVDVDDPGVALVGYKPRDVGPEGRRVCVFYNRPGGCYRGNRCTFMHTKVQEGGISFDQTPVLQFDSDQSSLLPTPGSCVGLTVSAIFSPQLFYVTLPWSGLTLDRLTSDPSAVNKLTQTETLEVLMDSLQEFYKGSHYDGDMTSKAAGQALAVKVKDDWLRAKVVDVDPDNERVQIMCVDFGDLYWVHERSTRELEMRFSHLPPQAVECCLEVVTQCDRESIASWLWEADSVKLFADLVKDKTLVGHIKHRFASGRILLSLIDTSNPQQEKEIGRELTKAFYQSVGLSPPRSQEVVAGTPAKKAPPRNQENGGVNFFPG